MARILCYSSPPFVQSGYATACRYTIQHLRDHGHEVALFAWNALRGTIIEWNGFRVYPAGNTMTGHDVLAGHIKHFDADLLLSICDPWIVAPENWKAGHDASLIHWFPCQTDPAGKALVASLQPADAALCYSQWGTSVLQHCGAPQVRYAPLGVDTDVYAPLNKEECKKWLGDRLEVDLSDKYVVGMVAANSSTLPLMRKNFDGNLLAFKKFKTEVCPEAVFYIHTWQYGWPGGFDLTPLIASLDMVVGRDVFFPSSYNYRVGLNDAWMVKMYNALDVLTEATLGEGFGLPLVEAQACGVPVVSSNWSSLPELTRYGLIVPIAAHQWVAGEMEGWVAVPSPDGIVNALTRIYHQHLGKDHIGSDVQDGLALADKLRWSRIVDEYVAPVVDEVMSGRS